MRLRFGYSLDFFVNLCIVCDDSSWVLLIILLLVNVLYVLVRVCVVIMLLIVGILLLRNGILFCSNDRMFGK